MSEAQLRAGVPPAIDWNRNFYLAMALLIALVVAYGFSQTINQNLLDPQIPRPWILYLHAAVFFGWVALFIAQTALIRTRSIKRHRQLGVAGVCLGILVPVVGLPTAIIMSQFNIANGLRSPDYVAAFLIVPINDMVAFSACLALAFWWRRKREYHRRLMLIATCCLTAAGFARFPFITFDAIRWYGGVDLLILLGVGHDLVVNRQVHQVYRYAVPLLLFCQLVTMTLFLTKAPIWTEFAHHLID